MPSHANGVVRPKAVDEPTHNTHPKTSMSNDGTNRTHPRQSNERMSSPPTQPSVASRIARTDPSDLHPRTCQRTECRLSTWSRRLGLATPRGAQLDVQCGDPELLALGSCILCRQHGCVGRRFVAIGFDFHAACHTRQGFLARKIRDVHEGVVERGEDVGHAEHVLSFSHRQVVRAILLRLPNPPTSRPIRRPRQRPPPLRFVARFPRASVFVRFFSTSILPFVPHVSPPASKPVQRTIATDSLVSCARVRRRGGGRCLRLTRMVHLTSLRPSSTPPEENERYGTTVRTRRNPTPLLRLKSPLSCGVLNTNQGGVSAERRPTRASESRRW